MGRGGREHKYLQNLIKRLAESRNWRAVIEQQILGGAGSVDVSLEKDSRSIACEISVSSTVELELGNIQKCLAAGYERVIAISPDRKFLGQLRKTAESDLAKDTRDKVLFMSPDEFVAWLEGQEAQAAAKTETVRGYRVKVQYTPLAEREKETKKQAISEVVLRAMRRLKKDS